MDACTRGSGPPQLIVSDDGDDNGSDADCDADDEVEAGNDDSSAGFNWAAYHEVWHDTSFDRAVTALFAEYASLYSRMSGQARSCVPPPMTLGRGLSVSEQASRFVTLYVNPILGAIHSTKVHKLLCRIMSAIRWHGDFQNGNTADNDSQHKLDKPFYSRTNKHLTDYTRQLVLRARGAQAVLRRLDEVDGRAGSSGSRRGLRHRDTPSGAHDAPPAAPPHGVSAAERPQRLSSAYHLRQVTVDELEARPDLAGVGAMLGLSGDAKVHLVSHTKINAVMDCGARTVQTVHASASYFGLAWYDAVLHRDGSGAPGTVSVGVLRAVLLIGHGDIAIVAELEEVAGQPGCPLQERGCARLAWRVFPGTTRIVIRIIPLSTIRRLLLLMPDFADLSERREVTAAPPSDAGNQAERVRMRFFVNDFHPWEVDGRR